MKQRINVVDSYGKKLKDELNVNNGANLHGEVEIFVKNKNTGKIESQQRHNMIVYGGREWLMKKAFGSQLSDTSDWIKNSEICWFGVGDGGGEPGNPLQCGCTYGSDTDLYNPIRMRSDVDSNTSTINTFYGSRIMPNGSTVSGYYKKITNVAIKEDQANPYKENGIIKYPKLIAEIRLEISSDDHSGQSYTSNDYNKSYADINEAALFIADRTKLDPGKDTQRSSISYTYTNQDGTGKRVYKEAKQPLPTYKNVSNLKYKWDSDNGYPYNNVRFYDFYEKEELTLVNGVFLINGEEAYDTTATTLEDAADLALDIGGETKYYVLRKKLNKEPHLFGVFEYGIASFGELELEPNDTTATISYRFKKAASEEWEVEKSFEFDITNPDITLDDILIVSHETIEISVEKDSRISSDKEILTSFMYKRGYSTAEVPLRYSQNLFETNNSTKAYFATGYTYDENFELMEDINFNNECYIIVNQYIDLTTPIEILAVEPEPYSYAVKLYVSEEDVKKVHEGQKLYTITSLDTIPENIIPEDNPSTIISVYDPEQDDSVVAGMNQPYIIIERRGMAKYDYTGDESESESESESNNELSNAIIAKVYSEPTDKPYTMWARTTFSTIRINQNREILLVWRVYF